MIKKLPWKLIAIIVIVAGYALNLADASIGGYATIFNLAVTIGYAAFWILYLIYTKNSISRLTFSCIISGLTCISSFLITIVNFTDYTIKYWDTVHLLTFFATPFYGVRIFVHNMSWCMVTITMITAIWFGFSLFLRKCSK